ncbi:hypothetical protein K1T71_014006 [Dendrolimus kikuchii]|uniref:Uncharacterized protein n=1 Tax=Dendrolimus kikuchii TaxID=765133 RepID=A0ACC1CGJ9_9NEOP|nr:hypothetical protein K1T71_014006 [Dendrolimus kikuchii]
MSWLNLNQSLSSLKGQITNFASEVLSEGNSEETVDNSSTINPLVIELQEKCQKQELEIASLKKLSDELEATLQSERLSRKNGVREDESSWYWDPPPQSSNFDHHHIEDKYKLQIRALQDEISTLRERETIDLRPDAEEEISRLRLENQNLTANLEDLDNQHQLAMERLLSLKKELQKNFEVLKQEHEDLKSSNDEYTAEIKTLLGTVGERDKEIENLKSMKSDYDTLYHKYQNLERVHSLLRENAEKFQEENQDLHEEIFKLQEQVTKLEHDLEVAANASDLSHTVPKEKYEEVLKEVSELKSRRNLNTIQLDEVNIDDNAKSVIENLKRDINDLKHQITQNDSDHYNDTKSVKSEKIMQLYNKYVNFELPVDYVGEIPVMGDNIVLYKLESAFKTLNSFKKDIDNLEHKLSEKNHNINHLQTQIDDLTTENDFLTTDIQHFERELNEMKKNNDFLISEIAALKNTSKLEPIIETHEDNLAKLETELADCNRINKTFESEIKRIETELAEVRKEKTILQGSLSDLKLKYTSMLEELELFKNQTKAVQELENNTNCHNTEVLKRLTDEIDELKKKLNAANAKSEQLSIDLHIIENDKVLLTKQVDDLKHTLEEKSSAHKELECLKVALDHKLQDFESKIDEVIKHKEEAESDKIILEEKVYVLQKELMSKDKTTVPSPDFEKVIAEKLDTTSKLEAILKDNTTLTKTIEGLKMEIENLNQKQNELVKENSSRKKNCTKTNEENTDALQKKIEELKAKIIQQDLINDEISNLKTENQNLFDKKLHLEAELSSTDTKIINLEEEFEKLITDLNEKDTIIDTLNVTITKNNNTLVTLNETVKDLEKQVVLKNDELQRLKKDFDELSAQHNESSVKSNRSVEELNRLHIEKEEISKQIFNLQEEVNTKNNEISSLTNLLENIEKSNAEFKNTIEKKDKEIKELNQSIVEMTDKIKTVDNTTHHNDEYAKLVQEKDTIENAVTELKNKMIDKDKQLFEIKTKCEQLDKVALEYKAIIDQVSVEKTELINLINLKHNESVQYHNEIQRLNALILEQTNEFKRIIEEKDRLLQNHSDCANCVRLRVTLKEKDEIIMALNQNVTEFDRIKTELFNASETVRLLTEKCDNLDKSLAIQLEAVKKLTAENMQLLEQEHNSSRELERLRRHLVETEENYTQELMSSEQKLTECQARLHQVEERAKQTSTVYTSNSIRANQEVETLRNQIKLLEKQREDVQAKLSEAEDARSRSEAALTNLQVVLEQFQLDKERDILSTTEKIRNKMEDLKRQNIGLQEEISRLNVKLEEALAGLQAATRLGDQVSTKTAQINDLKEQVRTLQTSVAAAEERYYNAISNQQDKVDKNLVKNLIINYVLTSQNNLNKVQVLRILSTVLDFNQTECEKLGLVKAANATDSLAAEFVKFLENESKPRTPLPNMMGLTQTGSRSTTPNSRKSSTIGPNPTFEPNHRRNPSTGSNNLLFQNLENVETSSHVSRESDRDVKVVSPPLDTGVNQTRNTEGAILKYVLKDM